MSSRKGRYPAREVFTVGYEGRDVDELVELLRSRGVRTLVDVRLNAISRKQGFSKTLLGERLAEAGITYVHERELGNPKDNRDGYRAGNVSAHKRFARHLERNGADAVERVAQLVRSTPTSLLCVEREAHSCHRTAVADQLGISVVSL